MGGGKDTKPKIVPCCRSGSDAQQGRRMTMEDTHVHFDDVSEKYSFPKDITRAFYAVYDGHGGRRAAEAAEVSHTNSFALLFFFLDVVVVHECGGYNRDSFTSVF